MRKICSRCSRLALTGKQYCQICIKRPIFKKQAKWTSNKKRKNPYPLQNDKRWKQVRNQFIDQNPWCARHQIAGRLVGAQHVDHILPVRLRPDLAYDPEWLQSLCQPCHSSKTMAERSGIAYDYKNRMQYIIKGGSNVR